MNSAIFLCFVLFCCLNVVRPAPAEHEEAEPSLEEVFKRGGYYPGAGNVICKAVFVMGVSYKYN